jgi:4'-phosphopantetheinyl transferase superfamily
MGRLGRSLRRPAGRHALPRGGSAPRPGGRQAATRVHHRPPLRPQGPGAARRRTGTDIARMAGRPPVAAGHRRQHHALRRVPGRRRRPRSLRGVHRHRRRAPQTPSQRRPGHHRPAHGGSGAASAPAAPSRTHWDRLLFCAKEAAYKAWSPLTERSLGFEEAEITIDPDHHTFTATLLVPGPYLDRRELTGFTGRWLLTDGLVVTTITVPAAVPFSTPGTRGDDNAVQTGRNGVGDARSRPPWCAPRVALAISPTASVKVSRRGPVSS